MATLPFTVIDLTHTLHPTIPTWDGGCGFSHKRLLDHDLQAPYTFRTHEIQMQEGIGTHLDAPLHVISGGRDVCALALDELIAPAIVINVSSKMHEQYCVSVEDILDFEKSHGQIPVSTFVIVYTGWSQYWSAPKKYRNELVFPSISAQAAALLVHERDISGLGIDTLSPDCPVNNEYPVHNIVLSANKYIVENIANAELLPPVGCYTLALPLKIQGGTEAPLRMIALTGIK